MVYAVRQVMSKPLITVDDKSSAQDAILLMVEKDIGALAVTEKGKPVGMVTERDVMKKCCPQASCRKVRVREIMSRPLITVDGETPLDEAVEIMSKKNIRRLLVTKERKIVGIATQKDLMRGASIAFHALDLALSLI